MIFSAHTFKNKPLYIKFIMFIIPFLNMALMTTTKFETMTWIADMISNHYAMQCYFVL